MKQRIISIFLSILLVLSMFGGFNEAFAQGEKTDYIVQINVDAFNPGYENLLLQKNYGEANLLANEALDKFEDLLSYIKGVEVYDRITLFIPSICVRATEDAVKKISTLPNVVDVMVDEVIYASQPQKDTDIKIGPMMVDSNDLIGFDAPLELKYDGRGQVLSIIDSNMDPSHKAFYLSPGVTGKLSVNDINNLIEKEKLIAKSNSIKANAPWSSKIPFGWNYMTSKDNLNPEKEKEAHGQHVAGTVGGNHVDINGKDWHGVAPNSQLLFMNVMNNGRTGSSTYLKAMADSIVLGASAVNMSLGSTKGTPNSVPAPILNLINKGYSTATNFVIAAGNEGEYQGDLNIDNPDFGTIGAPSVATNAITVASLENKTMYASGFMHNGKQYQYRTAGKINFEEGNYEYVFAGKGKPEDFDGLDLNGKLALIYRGDITFSEKVNNAASHGAIGVIVSNNVPGLFGMVLENTSIPAISIDLEAGDILKAANDKKVYIETKTIPFKNPEYGELSAFTNWGLSIGGYMKPDITAPGGHIYSTQTNVEGLPMNTFGDMSGTSMATPHVTGGVGIIRQYIDSDTKFTNVSAKAELVKILMMNSAIPHVDPKTMVLTSPRRQGAGVMNLKKATELDFTVVSEKSGIPSEFVGNVDNTITLNLKVKNYSNKQRRLTPSVSTTIEARDGKVLLLRPDELFSMTYEEQAFDLQPFEEKNISINIPLENLENIKDFENGAFIDGFLSLKDNSDGMSANFAFVSFKGKYETIPSIEKPIYEFNFDLEHPMWWNHEFRKIPWFNYGTLFQTENGKDAKDNPLYKIAGLKNFDEINKLKHTKDEPKPIFEPIVFSPNDDGLNDNMFIYLVLTRNAKIQYELIAEDGTSTGKKLIGNLPKNNSFLPEENRPTYLGYKSPGGINLKTLPEGNYTFKLYSEAVKDAKDFYDETTREIKFSIDKTAPEFTASNLNEGVFKFKVVDSSFIREVAYSLDGKNFVEINKDSSDYYSFDVADGVDLSKIMIRAIDGGFNTGLKSLDQIINADKYGALTVKVETDSNEAANIEYTIKNEDGKEMLVTHPKTDLIVGKYTLEVTDHNPEYKLVGEKVREFEITTENKQIELTIKFEKIPTRSISIKLEEKSDLDYSDFDIYAIDSSDESRKYKFTRGSIYLENYFDAVLPFGNYNFVVDVKKATETKYKLYIDEVDLPYVIDENYENYSTIKGRLVKDIYKLNIIEKGLEGSNQIDYIASVPGSGVVTDIDKVSAGTYEIFPLNVPEGYYLDGIPTVTLSEENPVQDVIVNYKKDDGRKIALTLKDNTSDSNAGDYIIYDYKSYLDLGGQEYRVKSNETIQLPRGKYLIEVLSNEDYYGKVANQNGEPVLNGDSIFANLLNENVEAEFVYTAYNGKEPLSDSAIFIEDENAIGNYSYEYTLTPKVGDKLNFTFEKSTFSSWFIGNIPYGFYTIDVKGLKPGYTVEPKSIIVSRFEFAKTFRIVKDNEETVDVDFKFMADGEVVSPVKFNLNGKAMTDGINKVATGDYKLEITELPVGFEALNAVENITISNDTSEIIVAVQKAVTDGVKVTADVFDFSRLMNNNLDVVALSKSGREFRAKINGNYSVKTAEFNLPAGQYELMVISKDKALQPEFTNYGNFTVTDQELKLDSAYKIYVYKAYPVEVLAKTEDGEEFELEYKVTKTDGNKSAEFDIDSLPGVRTYPGKEYMVNAINLPEGLSLVKNPLPANYFEQYGIGGYNKVEFQVVKGDMPAQNGTITAEFYEEENGVEKKLDSYLYAMDQNFNFYYNGQAKEVEFGSYKLKLSSIWNMSGKYDDEKSIVENELVINKDNPNAIAKFVFVVKSETPEPITYSVTFDYGYDNKKETVEVVEGQVVTRPENPEREEYIFDAWYKDVDLTEEYDFESKITEDITLYAGWTKLKIEPKYMTYNMAKNAGYFEHLKNPIELNWMDLRYGMQMHNKTLRRFDGVATTVDQFIDYENPTIVLVGDINNKASLDMWEEVLRENLTDVNIINGVVMGTQGQLNRLLMKNRLFASNEEKFARGAASIHIMAPGKKPFMFMLDKFGKLLNFGEYNLELMKTMIEQGQNNLATESNTENMDGAINYESLLLTGAYDGLSRDEIRSIERNFGDDIKDIRITDVDGNWIKSGDRLDNETTVILIGNTRYENTIKMFEDGIKLMENGVNVKLLSTFTSRRDLKMLSFIDKFKEARENLFRNGIILYNKAGLRQNTVLIIDKNHKIIGVKTYDNMESTMEFYEKLKGYHTVK